MAIIVELIQRAAPWLYGACVLAALWYLRTVLIARHERKYAVFKLEREAAFNRVYGAWLGAIGLALAMGLIYLISTVDAVQPSAQEGLPTATPTLAAAGTPTITPTLPSPDTTSTHTPTRKPRPTPVPQPTLAQVNTVTPAPVRPRCGDPRAVITAPGINESVSGMVPIFGTATHEQFQFYKLEYGVGANPAVWSYFDGGDRAVRNGRLGTLNAGALAPGAYSVRIVVVDATGNFVDPPCQTTVVIR